MRKPCKECPWIVDSNNNKIIRKFSTKHNKEHNCHMLASDLWDVKKECVCVGIKK